MNKNLFAWAACAAAVLSALSPSAAAQPARPAAPSILLEQEPDDNAALPRRAMAGSAQSGRFNVGVLASGRLRLEVPDGRVLVAIRSKEIKSALGEHTWLGEFEGAPGSLVSLTLYRGHASGFMHYGFETWELRPLGPGRSQLFRVDTLGLPGEPPLPDTPADPNPSSVQLPAGTAAEPVTQDILVVYTAAVAAAQGGAAALESAAINAVNAANTAYINSQVGLRLNLVGLRQVTYTETGNMSTSLSHLQSTSDGQMDIVHTWRNETGADLVALLTNETNYCGIAYLGSATGNAAYGFSVTSPNCFSNQTFAHEVGHNQGNAHDRPNAGGQGAYPYSYGYRTCDTTPTAATQFRTVMGYSCTSSSGATVPRVNFFSNPNVTYNGAPMGIAYGTGTETTAADNARSMNSTAGVIAAYRNPVNALPTAPGNLGGNATAFNSITLTWIDSASNETGFVVQRASGGAAFVDIATLGANVSSFVNSGLTGGTSYSYRVRAFNSLGNSDYSNTVQVTTPAAPTLPAQPSPSAMSVSTRTVAVTWTDVSNETGYEVLRETWDARRLRWGAANTTTVGANVSRLTQNVKAGTYRYSVRAVNAVGASAGVTSACTGNAATATTSGCSSSNPVGALVVR